MKAQLAAMTMIPLLLSGCSVFVTSQRDIRDEQKTAITTRAVSLTLFTAKSDLARFKVSQTEKTQSADVGLTQQSAEPEASKVVPALIGK